MQNTNTDWQLAKLIEHLLFLNDFFYFRETEGVCTCKHTGVMGRGRGSESLKADSALNPTQGLIPQSQDHDISRNQESWMLNQVYHPGAQHLLLKYMFMFVLNYFSLNNKNP